MPLFCTYLLHVMSNKYLDRIKDFWESLSRDDDSEDPEGTEREKIVVFAISIVLAFALWMLVNLNREYSIGIELPIEVGNVTADLALAEELPETVTANINGSGWDLISMYNNPPQLYLDVSGEEVNLFEQAQRQISGVSNVTVQTVEPLYLQVKMEPRESKKVPVVSNVDISFASQYGFLSQPRLQPDSVTIRGAASHIADISEWPTESLTFSNVNENLSTTINLQEPSSLVTLSQTSVQYAAEVVEFTEGEVNVEVETRDFPVGNVVTFSPSSVDVKYRVPLDEYADFTQGQTFTAYVNYEQIQQDTTGFVAPQIEKMTGATYIRIRSVQPREVAYFTIIEN